MQVNSERLRPLNEGTPNEVDTTVVRVADLFARILNLIEGPSVRREGLRNTPERFAKFITEFTSKDSEPPGLTVFDSEGADQLITQEGLPVASLCEHHCLTFVGTAFVGYIPNGKIVGLSKLGRLVRYYSRGLQNQERITRQIGEHLLKSEELKPKAVGVSLRCWHSCVSVRGIEAKEAMTTTTFLSDVFKSDSAARAEFLGSVKHNSFF
jgi:GTP cyclohydrolase I